LPLWADARLSEKPREQRNHAILLSNRAIVAKRIPDLALGCRSRLYELQSIGIGGLKPIGNALFIFFFRRKPWALKRFSWRAILVDQIKRL
jgi:hypothetical protein